MKKKIKITKSMILGLIHKYRDKIRDGRCGGVVRKSTVDACLKAEGYTKDD